MVSVCEVDPAACCVGDSEVIEGRGLFAGGVFALPPPQLGSAEMRASIISIGRALPRLLRAETATRQSPSSGSMLLNVHGADGLSFEAVLRIWPIGVVEMVKVVEPCPLTWVGLKLHVVSTGRPEQEKLLTVPENPPRAETLMVTARDCPCATVTGEVPTPIEKSGMSTVTAPEDELG